MKKFKIFAIRLYPEFFKKRYILEPSIQPFFLENFEQIKFMFSSIRNLI